MRKKIGVDIDEVITDEGRGDDNVWHKKICEYFNLTTKESSAYDFTEAYGLSESEVEKFMLEKGKEIMRNISPRPHCKETLTEFKTKNWDIILITARSVEDKKLTTTWLKKHNIPYDDLFFSDNKIEVCQKEKIRLFIDDHVKHLYPLKEAGIPVLLMNMPHNQEVNGKFKRVNNWLEIKKEARKILATN